MRDPAELLSAYFDDSLAEGEAAELRAWLAADPRRLRLFVRESVIHSRLRDVLQQHDMRGLVFDGAFGDAIDPQHIASLLDEEEAAQRAREAAEQALLENAALAGTGELLDRKLLRIDEPRVPSLLVYAGVVAAAALLVMVGRLLGPVAEPVANPVAAAPRAPVAPPVIAEIANTFDAELVCGERPIAAGAQLSAGLLTLQRGVAEIKFNSGAKLVVEGPAELQLLTADRAKLVSGRVVAYVPQQALGFTLLSAAAAFVDLGTEFGVEIDGAGAASIHVLDGEVALVSDKKGTSPSRTLQRGVANEVSVEGAIADIPFDEARFVRRVPASAYELAVFKSRPLAYWRLDNADANAKLASEGRLALPTFVNAGITTVDNRTPGETSDGPPRGTRFSGAHDGIDVPGDAALGMVTNCTYEAWVLPAIAPGPQRIFSTFDRPHSGMAIGVVDGPWYKLPDDRLKLQLTVYGRYDCLSAMPIEADKWVHVAASVDADGTPTLYVDGELAGQRFRPMNPVDGEADIGAAPIEWDSSSETPAGAPTGGRARIGRNPEGVHGEIAPECWQGQVSNVAVYDRVLDEQEIRRHYAATRDKLTDHSSQRRLDVGKKELIQ